VTEFRDAEARAASRRLLATSERELQRIVLDMHDGPVQDIFAALSQLQVLERALAGDPPTQQRSRQAVRLLERALSEIRNFIGAFRPPGFERRALGEIIEGLAVQHETLTEQGVELALPDDLGDCRPRSRSTASCRRRSPTAIATRARPSSA
jgi:signal transduction histidine kinase